MLVLRPFVYRVDGLPSEAEGLQASYTPRLLWNGGILADDVQLESPMDLQIILLPFANVSEDAWPG